MKIGSALNADFMLLQATRQLERAHTHTCKEAYHGYALQATQEAIDSTLKVTSSSLRTATQTYGERSSELISCKMHSSTSMGSCCASVVPAASTAGPHCIICSRTPLSITRPTRISKKPMKHHLITLLEHATFVHEAPG